MSKIKDDSSALYFIAFIPPEPVYADALKLKMHFKERYESKAALNSPPHITLHMPFRWKEEKENRLTDTLSQFVTRFDPIKVCLDNFSCFEPRVIFINVINSEALAVFQKELQRIMKKEMNLFNANYKEEPYHPHLTLAFRDLKKAAFKTAWEDFKAREFKAEFMADKLALLKHNGQGWQIYREFTIESSYSTDTQRALETTEG